MVLLKDFLKKDEGVTSIEYGIIAILIAVVIVSAVTAVGTTLLTMYNKIAASI